MKLEKNKKKKEIASCRFCGKLIKFKKVQIKKIPKKHMSRIQFLKKIYFKFIPIELENNKHHKCEKYKKYEITKSTNN